MSLTALLAAVAAVSVGVGTWEAIAARRELRRSRSRAAPRRVPPRTTFVRLLTALGRRASASPPLALAGRIEAAGLRTPVGDVMALKAGGAAFALLVTVTLWSAFPGRVGSLVLVAAPVSAFVAPDLWLRRRRRRRGQRMQAELADVLDLVRVAVDAGLSVRRALAEVGRRHPGPLAAELRYTAVLLELGVPYEEAVESLPRRCPTDGINSLVAALRRAERHGSPLQNALTAQADEARNRRSRAATETAARAAPKIQLVVALLLVPSAMLLVAAALIPALAWR